MEALDIEALLSPISEENRGGENLEEGYELFQLDKDANDATPLDAKNRAERWRSVCTDATHLLERSKDVRVVTYLCRGLLERDGVEGLRVGTDVLVALLGDETLEDSLYPRDDIALVNAVEALIDPETMIGRVVRAPLLVSPTGNAIDLHLLRETLGEEDADRGPLLAALAGVSIEAVAARRECLSATERNVCEIVDLVDARVKAQGANLDALRGELRGAQRFLAQCEALVAELTGVALDAPEPDGDDGGPDDAHHDDSVAYLDQHDKRQAHPPDAAVKGPGKATISSREDVTRTLALICEYYRAHEPSSPVPVLLERAASLVHKDFISIIDNLVPSARDEARHYAARRPEDPQD